MSEKKYYVKLIQTGLSGSEERFQLHLWEHSGRYSYSSKVYDEEHNTSGLERFQFTKSKLAEIMGGAIYKCHEATAEWNELEHYDWDYNPYIDKYEWINPLIELVPVEDEE
ncbi:hypothetical protein [Lactococcus lactis]|uniref:hypothetical protein n=1 Tax=Lactococcus lactis TaxID=1358 RepID=UPI001911D461|nr:hypothetical protein [Lactococcus lactis]WDA67438.1 hypothetical protein IL310_01345 [Lactococcus lactis]WDA67491.1 hypothetical protein IL310_01030 [Lactococcus lactis]